MYPKPYKNPIKAYPLLSASVFTGVDVRIGGVVKGTKREWNSHLIVHAKPKMTESCKEVDQVSHPVLQIAQTVKL